MSQTEQAIAKIRRDITYDEASLERAQQARETATDEKQVRLWDEMIRRIEADLKEYRIRLAEATQPGPFGTPPVIPGVW